MADAKVLEQKQGIRVHWTTPDVPQVYADEALLHYVNDRIYIAFGQIQLPVAPPMTMEQVEVAPVARVVLSEAAFHKIVGMLNRVARDIPNSGEK